MATIQGKTQCAFQSHEKEKGIQYNSNATDHHDVKILPSDENPKEFLVGDLSISFATNAVLFAKTQGMNDAINSQTGLLDASQ